MVTTAGTVSGQETPIYDEVRAEQHFDPATADPTGLDESERGARG